MLLATDIAHRYDEKVNITFNDITLDKDSQLLVLGGSGVGKTTLLHLLGGLISLQQGEISLDGVSYSHFNGAKLDRFRANYIGLVFQKPHLLSSLDVMENLVLSQTLAGKPVDKKLIRELLESVGLSNKMKARISELSAGQSQRVAVVRSIINSPSLILADEPTSSLDDHNAMEVLELLLHHATEKKAILIITTHDHRVKEKIKNQYVL